MDIFITGISSGLGGRLAKSLLLDGHRIFGVSRRPIADPNIRELQQIGNLIYYSADLLDPESMIGITADLHKSGVTLDRVVINAAVIHDDLSDSFELDCEKTFESLRVNFLSSVALVRGLLPFLRAEGGFMAISSLSVLCDLDPNRIGYPLSKIALNAFFNSLMLKFPTHPTFTVVNLGRMEIKARGLFTVSYDQAVVKIKGLLSLQKSRIHYFPLRVAIPSLLLGKLPLRIRRYFVAKRRNIRLSVPARVVAEPKST